MCICVYVYMCKCVYVYMCICVYVNKCMYPYRHCTMRIVHDLYCTIIGAQGKQKCSYRSMETVTFTQANPWKHTKKTNLVSIPRRKGI